MPTEVMDVLEAQHRLILALCQLLAQHIGVAEAERYVGQADRLYARIEGESAR